MEKSKKLWKHHNNVSTAKSDSMSLARNRSARTTPIQQAATKFGKVADKVLSYTHHPLDQQDDRSLHIFIRFFTKRVFCK